MRIYSSTTSEADKFFRVDIGEEDGTIHIHTQNSDSRGHVPYMAFSADAWDELVRLVVKAREDRTVKP